MGFSFLGIQSILPWKKKNTKLAEKNKRAFGVVLRSVRSGDAGRSRDAVRSRTATYFFLFLSNPQRFPLCLDFPHSAPSSCRIAFLINAQGDSSRWITLSPLHH